MHVFAPALRSARQCCGPTETSRSICGAGADVGRGVADTLAVIGEACCKGGKRLSLRRWDMSGFWEECFGCASDSLGLFDPADTTSRLPDECCPPVLRMVSCPRRV